METFRVAVPQNDLDDLRRRVAATRWPDELDDAGWDYGVPGRYVRELADRWLHGFDWRAVEARLNAYPQFRTEIDGERIHFLHLRCADPDAPAIILSHGWPGSVAEFLDVLGPLAERFHLVVPSLPGFGFSGPTRSRGWGPVRIANAWAELMRRLGYRRYVAAGNDWGSTIAPELGRIAPDAVAGVHVTQLWTDTPDHLHDPSDDERAALDDQVWFEANMSAYHHVQAQQPQSLAFALADSPVGLLGWHCLIYREGLDPDFVLTNVSIHWLTGTVASAMRIYREDALHPVPAEPTTVPLGAAQFAHDYQPFRRLVPARHRQVVAWNVYDRPGHFAAHQSPELLIADLTEFVTGLGR